MYLEKFRLDGKRAVVTGGGRAIGLAEVHALAEAGAHVVIADYDMDVARAGQAEMKQAGFDVDIEQVDVTKPDDVTRLADALNARLGSIDVLVCNAGIARSGTAAEEVTDEHWLNVIDVNLNGVFWCCRAFGKHMLERKSGAIVTIGSMSGFIVNKPQKQSFYNASKAGVHHLTRSLATEWADRGVRVNSVAPTYIETPLTKFGMDDPTMYPTWLEMTPMGRVGQPHEIGSVVLFLASEASSLMTGSIVLADAGYSAW